MGFGPMGSHGYLGGRELAIDFRHPETGEPYNPDFAALARSCGIEGVRIDRAGDLGDAIKAAIATGRPYLIDANIGADLNPGGAGVWELPRHGVASRLSAGGTSRVRRSRRSRRRGGDKPTSSPSSRRTATGRPQQPKE